MRYSIEEEEFLGRLEELLSSDFTWYDVIMFVKYDEMTFYLLCNSAEKDYSVPLTLIDGTDDGRLYDMVMGEGAVEDTLADFRLDGRSVRWSGSIETLKGAENVFGHMLRELG